MNLESLSSFMELSKNFRHKSVLEKRQEIKSFLELSYKDFFIIMPMKIFFLI